MGCYNQCKTKRLLIHRMQKSAKLHTLALITGHLLLGGGATTREWGGGSEVLPLQKSGGVEKSFSCAEVGGHKSFEVVLPRELEVLAIVMGWGRKKFPLFRVRLRWLGVVLQYPGKIYSFLFSNNILIMIINY